MEKIRTRRFAPTCIVSALAGGLYLREMMVVIISLGFLGVWLFGLFMYKIVGLLRWENVYQSEEAKYGIITTIRCIG